MGLRSGSDVRRCGALTAATLLEAESAPTARVLCRRAFRNIFSSYVSPLVMRGNNCNQVAIALRGDGDERLMEVWGSQSEQNCQEGLAGLGWRGERVPSSARANHQTERILLDQSLPSDPTRQQPKSGSPLQSSKRSRQQQAPFSTCLMDRILIDQHPASISRFLGWRLPSD